MSTTTAAQAALSQASGTLWLATLALMTAFMRTPAPAHRYLLARRIARNFETLREQECFTPRTRASFAKLAGQWNRKAEGLSPVDGRPPGMFGRLQRLFAR
jgi:hypothetical protein